VDDEATQALMIEFYRLWNPQAKPGDPKRPKGVEGAGRKGLGAAAALKQAQAFICGHNKWKHPYYWAAWVLWGLPN
jgi:CHAT domain-containing protein